MNHKLSKSAHVGVRGTNQGAYRKRITSTFATILAALALAVSTVPAGATPPLPDDALPTDPGISEEQSGARETPSGEETETPVPGGEETEVRAPADNETETPAPAAEGDQRLVPRDEYTFIAVSSEAPYGSEGDGTGPAALSDNPGHMWSVKYGDPGPHWIAFDTGATRSLLGIQYQNKQANGSIDTYRVYTSTDKGVVSDPGNFELWGDPVYEGSFQEEYTVSGPKTDYKGMFEDPVRGRYILFQPIKTVTSSNPEPGVTFINVFDVEGEEIVETDPGAGDATPIDLNAEGFSVQVAQEFPQVIRYGFVSKDGNVMDNPNSLAGQSEKLSRFTLNGTDYTVETEVGEKGSDKVSYESTVADEGAFKGMVIKSSITIDKDGTVKFRIDEIAGNGEPNLNSIAIPGHQLISASANDDGAVLSRTTIATDPRTNSDVHVPINAEAANGQWDTPYAFITNGALSAGIYSNSTKQSGSTYTNQRLTSRIFSADGTKTAALQAGSWVWHPTGVADPRVTTYKNPEATIVVAAPDNEDAASWQDAARKLRNVIPQTPGSERVPERVAQRIPFNFASEATNPFMKTLDNVKKVALATDGLGQWNLLKGYGSEGHDSANTDYGGHYNTGAGGLDDLKKLTELGGEYNSDFGVHVNATEVYHNARSFSDYSTDNGRSLGWGWLNQSYGINQTKDLGLLDAPEGYVGSIDRFKQLRNEVPNLDTLYIDVWYSSGWIPEALAEELRDMGWEIASEWSYAFEGNSIWSHWANDKPYGAGNYNKGLNSQMVRFMFNTDRDMWNQDKLLGGLNMLDFEGWAGKYDWTSYKDSLWTDALPTKYLQHFDVEKWEAGSSASLSNGVEITLDKDGNRVVTQGGVEVLRSKWTPSSSNPAYDGHTNNVYLLPWQDVDSDSQGNPLKANKMYYFNENGGEATFELAAPFEGQTNFVQYKLTDTGREKVADITAASGKVTLNGEAGVPYVLVPTGNTVPFADVEWGGGTGLKDPGFNAGNLDVWNPAGDAKIANDNRGSLAQFGEAASTISQEITVEAGKKYAFSAMVGMGWGEREFTIGAKGAGVDVSRTFTTSPAMNYVASEPRHNSQLQRTKVEFTAESAGKVVVSLAAVKGTQVVSIDDARLIEVKDLTEQYVSWGETAVESIVEQVPEGAAFWTFEDNQPGYGPFVRGNATGAGGDARTSVSELHFPYSQKDWKNNHIPFNTGTANGWGTDDVLSGMRSLKTHVEPSGLVYRTVPAKVDFKAGHKYRVSFSYQHSHAGAHDWLIGTDNVSRQANGAKIVQAIPMPQALETTRFSQEIVIGCGDTWVGLRSNAVSNADFVLDDFMVEDLGESTESPVCGDVGMSSGGFDRGTSNVLTTTFTNNHPEAVTNVYTTITGLPDGWTAKLEREDGNSFAEVAAGASVTTRWLVDVPEDAELGTFQIGANTIYALKCSDDVEVTKNLSVTVAGRPSVPTAEMSAFASSSQSGEGIDKALDGNLTTMWHTTWSGTPHPHYAWFDLRSQREIDGFGYQHRQNGVNGKIRDYAIYATNDSDLFAKRTQMNGKWEGTEGVVTLASGTFTSADLNMQVIDFDKGNYRYVIFESKSAQTQDSSVYSSAAELRIYTTVASFRDGFEIKDRPENDPGACPSEPVVTVDSTFRCVAGKAVLAVSVTNEAEEAAEVKVNTPFGSKQLLVSPGKTSSQAFSTRKVSVPAGEVLAEFLVGSGTPSTGKTTAGFDAFDCG